MGSNPAVASSVNGAYAARCLRPDPAAADPLAQIRDNLLARIAKAESHRLVR